MILNCQFYNGDRTQAMALARLIADLELVKRTDCTFLFSARFDTKHDLETVAYVAQKFHVMTFTGKRNATGWPNGPNQLAGESYQFCVEKGRIRSGFMGERDNAVLMMEADCVPLAKNWINQLQAEWKQCQKAGKLFLGAWLSNQDAGSEHVNGNCIISFDFWKKSRSIFLPPAQGGWDAMLARFILPWAYPSRLIWSDYRLGCEENPWKGCGYLWEKKRYNGQRNKLFGQDLTPCYYHGIKTNEGIDCARQKLLS